ncbi:DNA-processing protein DprA [Cellulomonas pakistanensis]|uniref:DNA processing protein DprA n=1 Tax=Cellulomonas pakistanensis TaxID=992287 RepID=A0A919PDD2_9CELL|nr:DNA-processing protein DprA [Cellulomonas pakistanensis]GIG38113.1 DNA processing protein DprA [Cellulomonas pakistanensis]
MPGHPASRSTDDASGDGEVWARAAWSVVAEPGDATAGAVVAALGAPAALAWALWAVTTTPDHALARLRRLVARGGADGAELPDDEPGAATGEPGAGSGPWPPSTVRVLARALPRWAPRLADLDPRPALDDLAGRGGTLLVPGRPGWPARLDDLGPAAPLCLWARGDPDLAALTERSVAVVGARAATAYGERVAGDLGAGLAERGVTVVSGGAFGVDVAAHRGALAVGGRTVALLAGGIDRPSPAGNLAVLERLVDDGGALVAESPPGTPPSRARFLQRNRVIAALAGATVVVEAAWRSGALSTAARAAELLRPLGAVPGPVTSMVSVGCHRLLRDAGAVCVTDAAEAAELLAGAEPAPAPAQDDARGAAAGHGTPQAVGRGAHRPDSPAARVLDALLRRRALAAEEVARRAGLAEHEVVATLGLLELAGDVRRTEGTWLPTA